MGANGELAPLRVKARADTFAILFRLHGNGAIVNAVDNAVRGLDLGLLPVPILPERRYLIP
jgi:hypothetical protein